ncbi:DUF817 family protein [Bacillus canaveralius]
MRYIKDLLSFGYKQALSCIFPAVIFLTLAISQLVSFLPLARYDFILIICLITFYLDCRKHCHLLGCLAISKSAGQLEPCGF